MKVGLGGEFGVVIRTGGEALWDQEPGVIRWDTAEKKDEEDWRGLYASFIAAGGTELRQDHVFQYIDDAGNLIFTDEQE